MWLLDAVSTASSLFSASHELIEGKEEPKINSAAQVSRMTPSRTGTKIDGQDGLKGDRDTNAPKFYEALLSVEGEVDELKVVICLQRKPAMANINTRPVGFKTTGSRCHLMGSITVPNCAPPIGEFF